MTVGQENLLFYSLPESTAAHPARIFLEEPGDPNPRIACF